MGNRNDRNGFHAHKRRCVQLNMSCDQLRLREERKITVACWGDELWLWANPYVANFRRWCEEYELEQIKLADEADAKAEAEANALPVSAVTARSGTDPIALAWVDTGTGTEPGRTFTERVYHITAKKVSRKLTTYQVTYK